LQRLSNASKGKAFRSQKQNFVFSEAGALKKGTTFFKEPVLEFVKKSSLKKAKKT
jgi:hypothetical protein